MCVIAACFKRPMTKDEFDNCFNSNRDGAGFGWRENGVVKFQKGFMGLDEAWKFYSDEVCKHMPHVAHFRIRTAGAVCKELTHPFVISDTSPAILSYSGKNPVIFHNGVFYNWECLIPYLEKKMNRKLKGPMSDSRFLALGLFFDKPIFIKYLRYSGAFVVIQKDKISITGDQFILENGIYFSNSSYKRPRYITTSSVASATSSSKTTATANVPFVTDGFKDKYSYRDQDYYDDVFNAIAHDDRLDNKNTIGSKVDDKDGKVSLPPLSTLQKQFKK